MIWRVTTSPIPYLLFFPEACAGSRMTATFVGADMKENTTSMHRTSAPTIEVRRAINLCSAICVAHCLVQEPCKCAPRKIHEQLTNILVVHCWLVKAHIWGLHEAITIGS